MGKEGLRHQAAKWVASRLDRLFAPRPRTGVPECLSGLFSERAEYVWCTTADKAADCVKPNEPILRCERLTEEEIVLLKKSVHEQIFMDEKSKAEAKRDKSGIGVFVELDGKYFNPPRKKDDVTGDVTKNNFPNTPTARALEKTIGEFGFNPYDSEVRAEFWPWKSAIEDLGKILLKEESSALEIEKACQTIKQKRPDLVKLRSKTPSGLQAPGGE